MEIVAPSGNVHHRWLEWLGLQEPPPEPDTWVPVARGFYVDELKTGSSKIASRLVDLLSGAGVQAHQRSYEFDASRVSFFSASGGMVMRVAVLVHNRDRERATEIATEFERDFERQRLERERELDATGYDQELTDDAPQAGAPPQV